MSKAEDNINSPVIENVADKLVRQAFLYDFYGELLNEHQRSVYEAYVSDNLSLSEIAEENKVSRQSVHDLIKRCDTMLEQYESKLHLFERFDMMKQDITKIQEIVLQSDKVEEADQINKICRKLLSEL